MSSRIWQILSPDDLRRLRDAYKSLCGKELELRESDDRPVKVVYPSLQEIDRNMRQPPSHQRKVD